MRIMLVAGEPSGDRLGAELVTSLREYLPEARFFGVAGSRMLACGVETLLPLQDLAVMGLAEVLPRLPLLLRHRATVLRALGEERPDLFVSIDAPGFNLPIQARARRLGIPAAHYVAPAVWAWAPGRAARIGRQVTHLLTLLPWEPTLFQPHGIDARFVGHPVLERGLDAGDRARFRSGHDIGERETVVLCLPGSRASVAARHAPIFAAALAALGPDTRTVIPAVDGTAAIVHAAPWPRPLILVEPDDATLADAIAGADLALTVAGTGALECAIGGLPSITAHRVNPLTAIAARRLLTVRRLNLVNLLLDAEVVPEFLQEDCVPARLTAAMRTLMIDEAARARQRTGGKQAAAMLYAEPGPARAAAAALLPLLGLNSLIRDETR